MEEQVDIAILGAGMGGLAAAGALRKFGVKAQVFEQAEQFLRVGAGIQMAANPMKVLRALGLEERLRSTAFRHVARLHRDYDTGAVKSEYDMWSVEEKFGAPHLMMHRADLHSALLSLLEPGSVHLNKKLLDFDQDGSGVSLRFADGSKVRARALIAADGVHSIVRKKLFGAESPRYTGRIAYRAVFSSKLLRGVDVGDVATKWWGPDRHIVIYYITAAKDEVYFTTSIPADTPDPESWTLKGDLNELRAAFKDFHGDVRAVLDACPDTFKWPIYDRDPQERWGEGRIYLLGDACHPMTPYMAQGAASAIEDAAMLARSMEAYGDLDKAFSVYEATRRPRASKIQSLSHLNRREWMKADINNLSAGPKEKAEPDWVYGYDAWTAPLIEPAPV